MKYQTSKPTSKNKFNFVGYKSSGAYSLDYRKMSVLSFQKLMAPPKKVRHMNRFHIFNTHHMHTITFSKCGFSLGFRMFLFSFIFILSQITYVFSVKANNFFHVTENSLIAFYLRNKYNS